MFVPTTEIHVGERITAEFTHFDFESDTTARAFTPTTTALSPADAALMS